MYGGFDPRATQALFFDRRRGRGLLVASIVYGGMLAWGLRHGPPEETVEVQLEPEIKDFAVEEEPEPEVQEEPPPPPESAPVKRIQKPRPPPELRPPDQEVKETAPETDQAKAYEVGPGSGRPGGTGTRPKDKPQPKPADKPPPPKKAEPPKIDPKKVVDRPEKATAPVADPGNQQPDYPETLRDKGITGVVVIKLHVNNDGSLRGAKILKVTNNAATEEEREQANALFKKAVIAVVRNWRYTPAKLEGQPITVWHTVTIPFRLSTG